MTRAIFYLTYNGVFNNTNGIGTQAKTFLSGVSQFYPALRKEFGDFSVHLVTPMYDERWWGYTPADLAYARDTVARLGGAVHVCPYRTSDDEFWTPASWLALSASAAATVLAQAQAYGSSLVIANDIPFLHTPLFIEHSKHDLAVTVQSIIALYGSSYIHTPHVLDARRLDWERVGLATPAAYPDVKIARFSDFMMRHFAERYGVEPASFVPLRSSLHLEHPEYGSVDEGQKQFVLAAFQIPEDRPLVFAFGRADWIKGFDLLLNALAAVRERVHLVLNAVPYAVDDPILGEYAELIRRIGLSATLLTGYSRELPRVLCQWHNTLVVVCPSRGEPLSNIPFEVSLWAKDAGPVLLCAGRDGFLEQIEDGRNGLLFDLDAPGDLEAKLKQVLALSEAEKRGLRQHAYARVVRERDFYCNFRETLTHVWGR